MPAEFATVRQKDEADRAFQRIPPSHFTKFDRAAVRAMSLEHGSYFFCHFGLQRAG